MHNKRATPTVSKENNNKTLTKPRLKGQKYDAFRENRNPDRLITLFYKCNLIHPVKKEGRKYLLQVPKHSGHLKKVKY